MRCLLLIYFCLILFGCESKKSKPIEPLSTGKVFLSEFDNNIKIKSLSEQAQKGDTAAYNKLYEIYSLSDHSEEFLYKAVTMAETYNYSQAYFDVYIILRSGKSNSKNSFTNKLANYYLLKAFEAGNSHSRFQIEERFNKREISSLPTSREYWNEILKN
ncbi:hypothetical protein [Pedobacter sp. ASV12]|uniref:hypothetical protein n=1 Tax=Pedobacter sp. ASV12 TaxID=2795120 RepID=UPI0018EAC916|nr:hypothetical protein [Pedobacter sp. ASV12]